MTANVASVPAKAAASALVAAFVLSASSAAPLFERVPAERCGVDFVNRFDEDGARSFLYQAGFACGAVAIGDLDGDAKPDLFFTGGAGENGLFFNRGDFNFERANDAALGGGDRWGAGTALVDFDADGDLDIYLCNYASPNQLSVNDGKGAFTERAAEVGLAVNGPSLEPVFADFDRDGDLDLFLVNSRLYLPGGRPEKPPYKMVDGKPVVTDAYAPYFEIGPDGPTNFFIDDYGHPDRLFLNEGGKFRDVTATSGISGKGHGLSATLGDYDGDGWIDIYVANDYLVPDRLWKNRGVVNGVPHFTNEIAALMPPRRRPSSTSCGSSPSPTSRTPRPGPSATRSTSSVWR